MESRCAIATVVRPRVTASRVALQAHLGGRVDRAGRLVEHQQVGVGDVGPDQRDQLPLAHAERLAALADRRVAGPCGSPSTQSARPSSVKASVQLVVGQVGPGEADVLGDRGVEQEPVLRHHHHPAAQRGEPHRRSAARRTAAPRPSVGSISRVSSLANVVLPLPVSPTTATRVCAGDRPGRRRCSTIGPPGIARSDTSSKRTRSGPGGRSTPGVAGVGHVRLDVEHVEHPAPAGDRVLRLVEHLGGDLHRLDEQRHQEQERGQLADGQRRRRRRAARRPPPPRPAPAPAAISPVEKLVTLVRSARCWATRRSLDRRCRAARAVRPATPYARITVGADHALGDRAEHRADALADRAVGARRAAAGTAGSRRPAGRNAAQHHQRELPRVDDHHDRGDHELADADAAGSRRPTAGTG